MAAYYPLFDDERLPASNDGTAKKIESLEMAIQHTVQRFEEYIPCVYAFADPPASGYSSLEFQKVQFTSFSNNLTHGDFMTPPKTVKAQITFFADYNRSKPLVTRIWCGRTLLVELSYEKGRAKFIASPLSKDKEIEVYIKSPDPKAMITLQIEILQYLS